MPKNIYSGVSLGTVYSRSAVLQDQLFTHGESQEKVVLDAVGSFEHLYKHFLPPDFRSFVMSSWVILLYDAQENWFSIVMLYVVWCSQ